MRKEWNGFKSGSWENEINVRDFIQKNYTPYEGCESFLEGATDNTKKLWEQTLELCKEETAKGVLDAETKIPASINAYGPGYLNKDTEKIVGFQTDKPLKRAIMPFGGLAVVKNALKSYGYELDPATEAIFKSYRKTHNDGVFDVYTDEMLRARRSGVITGLPDAYGRGRIIGDYRRLALYGVDRLIEQKVAEKLELATHDMSEHTIRLREN